MASYSLPHSSNYHIYIIKSHSKIWWIQILLRDKKRCSFEANIVGACTAFCPSTRKPPPSEFLPSPLSFIIRDCRAMRREAEKNVRDEIGEGQNAWQITRLVHRRNETKPRPRTANGAFVPIVAGCHFEVAGFAIQPERRGVSGRHQITPDKGTTNWYHPNALRGRYARR